MSRIDFSNRPCTDGRRRWMGLILPVFLLAVLTLANAVTFGVYRFRNRDLHQQIQAMERQAAELERNTRTAAAGLSRINVKSFQSDYSFIRHLARKKGLSWSALFRRLEELLPPTVRLTVISPTVKGNRLVLSISGEAMTKADELTFLEALNHDPSFRQPFIEFEQVDSASRNLKFSMTVDYLEGGDNVQAD